ncbi:S-layer homology domain-containing protein [Paenibacillus sp. CMAA1364]
MLKKSVRSIHSTSKVALLTMITCSLLLPQSYVFATSETAPRVETLTTSSTSKVAFSKEKAVAKVKNLFPILKNAETSNITLGSNNNYPGSADQKMWDIQWRYKSENTELSFSSQVDATTGNLISAYIYYPLGEIDSYYPPKLTRDQAKIEAKKFAVNALSLKSVHEIQDQNVDYSDNRQALFGPLQYSFYFTLDKNRIPSQAEMINLTMSANGQILQFNKPTESLTYPSPTPKITEIQANKQFKENLEIDLNYIPIYRNNKISDWILAYRPFENTHFPIDAMTGKKISYEGTDIPPSAMTYAEVPQTKDRFKPLNQKDQLSSEEAATIVQKIAKIPTGYVLQNKHLIPNYANPAQQLWNLVWIKDGGSPEFQMQYYADVDAFTGEITQFRYNNYAANGSNSDISIPKGLAKLTSKTAQQYAIDLVNRLYPNATDELKMLTYDKGWEYQADSKQYRYEFQRFYKGFPVSDGKVFINFDIYGRLQTYSANHLTGLEQIKETPAIQLTKEEALEAYRNQYKMKLQYSKFGGYYTDSKLIKPHLRLTYTPVHIDISKSNQVLDAVTGKWIAMFDGYRALNNMITPTDLIGHAAEKELTTLIDYGIIAPDSDGKVNPDVIITTGDWLTMIVKSITPYVEGYYGGMESDSVAGITPENPIYSVVRFAVEREWIKNDTTFQPDKKLTRDELATQLSSIVNYNKIALYLHKDPSVIQFSDAEAINNKGAVAIAIKLGLLEGANGKFNPQQTITNAQAASIIMKLVELQGKVDQAIGQQ